MLTDDAAALSGEAAALFILSFRHRDELTVAAGAGGWRPIAARRPAGVERRFIASGAAIAIVDARGAFDEALGAIRALADPVEANAASLMVLLSRGDVARLAEVFAAGATHYLASPFGDAELLQALRFADRAARRSGGTGISRTTLGQAEALGWTLRNGRFLLSAALAAWLRVPQDGLTVRAAWKRLARQDRAAAAEARRRLRAGYGSTAFSHGLSDGSRVVHHLSVAGGGLTGLLEMLDGKSAELPVDRDPLTGLPDGRAARLWLSRLLARGERVGLLLVGLSELQLVNNFYGRAGGDALLQAASRRIEAALHDATRGRARLARLAGAEFLIGLPQASIADLAGIADAAVAAIARRFVAAGEVFLLGAHVGGALAEDGDAGALLRRASAALAEAREGPAGTVRLLDPGAIESVPRGQRLAEELRRAMAAGQIDIVFQPQVCVSSGRIDGVEALARWRHPEFGEVGAEALFAAAQRAHLTGPLSELVQRRALEIAAAWPPALDRLRLSINVTAADLGQGDFAGEMLARIAASGFPAVRVTAEVTEEGLIEDLGAAGAMLAALRRGGCRVAVDDFGTGYSSLAYLKALPLDYLKLDRRLSQDIAGTARDRIVVRGVIDMARSLGLGVIAEGVETEEQLSLLAAEGCTLYQGFLCSEPVGTDELVRLVETPPTSSPRA